MIDVQFEVVWTLEKGAGKISGPVGFLTNKDTNTVFPVGLNDAKAQAALRSPKRKAIIAKIIGQTSGKRGGDHRKHVEEFAAIHADEAKGKTPEEFAQHLLSEVEKHSGKKREELGEAVRADLRDHAGRHAGRVEKKPKRETGRKTKGEEDVETPAPKESAQPTATPLSPPVTTRLSDVEQIARGNSPEQDQPVMRDYAAGLHYYVKPTQVRRSNDITYTAFVGRKSQPAYALSDVVMKPGTGHERITGATHDEATRKLFEAFKIGHVGTNLEPMGDVGRRIHATIKSEAVTREKTKGRGWQAAYDKVLSPNAAPVYTPGYMTGSDEVAALFQNIQHVDGSKKWEPKPAPASNHTEISKAIGHSVSKDPRRFGMTGYRVDRDGDGSLIAVGTNGQMLALTPISEDSGLIPGTTYSMDGTPLKANEGGNAFPKYEKVIPPMESDEYAAIVEPKVVADFASAVMKAKKLEGHDVPSSYLTNRDGNLYMNSDLYSGHVSMRIGLAPQSLMEGQRIGVSAKYLRDVMRSAKGQSVRMQLAHDPLWPIRFDTESGATQIVMPLRVQ